MYLTGFADEAANGIDGQIAAVKELGWSNIECRNVDGKNLTDVDDRTFPGEGDGHVREICADLRKTGYDGGFSIEPHLAVVFHDKSVQSPDEVRRRNFVEYGRRMEKILASAGYSSPGKGHA